MITGKCGYEGCQEDIKPATTEAQFNWNRGLHLRNRHGIRGATNTPEGRRQAALRRYRIKMGIPVEGPVRSYIHKEKSREEINAERRQMYHERYSQRAREYYHRHKQDKNNGSIDKAAVLKFICPECGCRIWTTARPA